MVEMVQNNQTNMPIQLNIFTNILADSAIKEPMLDTP